MWEKFLVIWFVLTFLWMIRNVIRFGVEAGDGRNWTCPDSECRGHIRSTSKSIVQTFQRQHEAMHEGRM